MKILFQGDSITDASRDKRNYHDMGKGYPKYAAELIAAAYPNAEIEFINLGIGGNRTDQLFDRLYPDAIALEPDIISILIGINDIWHRHGSAKIETTDEQIAVNYRAILDRLKKQTTAKILMIFPFLLDSEDKETWRPELERELTVIRALADEYADAVLPLDTLFDEALPSQPEPQFYSADGVHPNANGAEFIGRHYFEAIKPLLDALI